MFCSFVNWSILTCFFLNVHFLKHVKPGWVMLPNIGTILPTSRYLKMILSKALRCCIEDDQFLVPKWSRYFQQNDWTNQGNSLSDALKTVRRGGALNFHDAIDMIGAAFWEAIIILKWVRRTKGLHVGVVWLLCTAKSHGEWSFPLLKLPFWGVFLHFQSHP